VGVKACESRAQGRDVTLRAASWRKAAVVTTQSQALTSMVWEWPNAGVAPGQIRRAAVRRAVDREGYAAFVRA